MTNLPFNHGDIIAIDGDRYAVHLNPNMRKFCNLYEPGKPYAMEYHMGQILSNTPEKCV